MSAAHATEWLKVGAINVASCYSPQRLAELKVSRLRYDAACKKSLDLYTSEKTDEWRRSCDVARALSKTIPLTIAKRKLKNGKVVYGDEE